VRNSARSDDRFSRNELSADVTDLEGHLSLKHVEVLLLREVIVEWRAAVNQIPVLDDEEAAVGFGW
jgi:hypothetical protein